ncbi:MAG: hypothetical protein C4321_03540, partial [Chloroflexota bacterium]
MVKAFVLIVVDPAKTVEVYEKLRTVEGISEVYQVMGPYDIVAIVHDHPFGHGDDETIDLDRLLDVLATDWGWYRTARENVERTKAL